MEAYFDLFLKGLITVVILYIAFDTIFAYHPSVLLVDMAAIVLVLVLSFSFIGTDKIVIYAIVLAVVVISDIVIRIILFKKGVFHYLIYPLINKDVERCQEVVSHLKSAHNLKNENVSFREKFPFIIVISGSTAEKTKTFIRELDKEFSKFPKRFHWFQYVNIIMALIFMAAIWRF